MIFGVRLQVRGTRFAGRHPVSPRGHDQAVHLFVAPAAVDEFHRQPVQQFGMRGRVAHFPEVVEHGSQAAPEVVIPDAVDGHARGERVVAGQDPFGERQTASRCPAVGGRKFHRRIAYGGHGKKPRLHQRSVAVDVAVDQEIRGRGLIAARTGMDVRALNPGLRNAFARSRLVARAVGGEAVIAVGDPHGHRDGRGALFFNRFDGVQQILAGGRVLRPDDAVYLGG